MSTSSAATNPSSVSRVQYLEGSPDDYRLTWPWAAAIALFGATMLAINLGDVRVLTFHEVVFAQPAKEMLRDDHWIVPTIAGDPYNDRTPLVAWSIAGAMWLFGTDAEWAVRTPNVVFSILAALVIAWMAARWFGKRVGILAGFIELTTLQVLTNGRLAEADMLLSLTVVAAMYAFAAGNLESPRGVSRRKILPYLFYAAIAASFMVKWLFGPAFICTGCFAYAVVARDRKTWKFLFHPGGIVLALALTLPWMVAAVRVDPEIVQDFWNNHFGRFRGSFGKHEPWFAYVYLVPFMLLPWAPYAFGALSSRVRGAAKGASRFEPIGTFFICWFTPGMLLLSLSTFKAKHYTMPLLPPLTIACAVGLHEYLKRRAVAPNHALPWLLGVTICGGIGGVIALALRRPADWQAIAAVAVVAMGGVSLAMVLEMRRKFDGVPAALFGTIWGAAVVVQTWIMPSHDSYRNLAEFGRRVATHVPPDETVHLLFLPESQVSFYIDRPLRLGHNREVWQTDYPAKLPLPETTEPVYIVASTAFLDRIEAAGQVRVLDQAEREARHVYNKDRVSLIEFRATPQTTAVPNDAEKR